MLSASVCRFPREKHLYYDPWLNAMTHFFVQQLASVNFFNSTNMELSSFLYITLYKTKLKQNCQFIINVKHCSWVKRGQREELTQNKMNINYNYTSLSLRGSSNTLPRIPNFLPSLSLPSSTLPPPLVPYLFYQLEILTIFCVCVSI